MPRIYTDSSFELGRPTKGKRIRRTLSNVFLGLCVMAVGIGYLGNYVDALPWSGFTVFFNGWGGLLMVVASIYYLIRSPFSLFWAVCLLIGGLILLAKLGIYSVNTVMGIGASLVVILCGLRILLSSVFKRLKRRRWQKKMQHIHENLGSGMVFTDAVSSEGDGCYNVRFASRTVTLCDQFTSATLNVSFGELTLDLRQTTVTDCAVIDADCSFGSLKILLPADVRAEVQRNGDFSSVEARHKNPKHDAPVVYVNATCAFGTIEIK